MSAVSRQLPASLYRVPVERLLLVANPAASGFTAALHREVLATLRRRFEVTPAWPSGPEEAEATAHRAALDGIEVVAAMGGDGIVHRVANGIVTTGSALAVIPAGTGNVFARITGHPRRGGAAARAIVASTRIGALPTIRLEATGQSTSIARIVLFAAGLGYDADVIRDSEHRPLGKVGSGTIHYTRSALRVALGGYRRRSPDMTVSVDGERRRASTVIAQVHERFTFLGRRALTLSPEGGPAAIALERVSPGRLLRVLGRAARHRTPTVVSGVTLWHPFVHLTATVDGVAGLEADGEYLGEVAALSLVVAPESLRLVDPRPARKSSVAESDPEV